MTDRRQVACCPSCCGIRGHHATDDSFMGAECECGVESLAGLCPACPRESCARPDCTCTNDARTCRCQCADCAAHAKVAESEQTTLDEIRMLLAKARTLAATIRPMWRSSVTRTLRESLQQADEAALVLGIMRHGDDVRAMATQPRAES